MNTGLSQIDIKRVITAVKQFPEIEDAVIFGSRAEGTHDKASDVDLAIKGRAVTAETIRRLDFLLNEGLPLPYYFDLVHYETLEDQALINHIDKVGKSISFLAAQIQ